MSSDDNPRVFLPPPLIFGALLTLGLILDCHRFAYGSIQIIGIVLTTIGMVLIAIALGLFRVSRTRPEPWQPANTLVTGGIYRNTRNPMYLGMTLLSLGVALIFTSLPGGVLALVSAAIIDRTVVPREEAYLTRRFGEDYLAYTRSVRRWL